MSAPKDAPIAVIGIGCRFAGGIDSPAVLWQVLTDSRNVVDEVPPHRWDIDAVYDPEPGIAGRTASRWGAFLDDVSGFEPAQDAPAPPSRRDTDGARPTRVG
ncbi:beta-ketoacyl synthase N-terminal-like domain-containing protein, partial [Streptomyces sp. NPDC059070]|uniref:beta-ketoacyl synthase N-terminal-like domain-containing protein n=1 Tax=Streptomyces sp. NPDC059070 TaxID=3346713 RepID=UPI0036C8FD27